MHPLLAAILATAPPQFIDMDRFIELSIPKDLTTIDAISILRKWQGYTESLKRDIEGLQAIVDSYEGEEP